MFPPDIFAFIKAEESRYDSEEMQFPHWSWNMKRHVEMSMSFRNSKFTEGFNDYLRPFKNIVRPLLNLRYRAEDIDIKDVLIYVDNAKNHHLSFLVKKYHDEVFVKEHNLDTFFDEAKEEKIDYGGVIVQKTNKVQPEVLPLQSIAFCDQTDILAGPIGFKHSFSPEKLRQMSEVGWGEKKNGATLSIEDIIKQAKPEKEVFQSASGSKNQTSGKNIEIYIVHGMLPESYLTEDGDEENIVFQVHVVGFYSVEGKRQHAILYRKKEFENPLKFHTAKKIFGRALGEGGVEELFEAQIWTNFYEIHKMKLLEAGSKVLLQTDDVAFANRNKIRDMENLEIAVTADGKSINQIPTLASSNIQLFEQSIDVWYRFAQVTSSATDPLLGQTPPSGTPFRLEERVVQEGKGIHEYRRGQFAKFIEEIYQDWIIPYIAKEITKGQEFLATLTSDEMQWVSERMAENRADRKRMEQVLNDEFPDDKETLKQQYIQEFTKGGNKKWIRILKDELKDISLKVNINVAGKQKDLVHMTDKIVNIFRFIFSNPQGFIQAMQIPGMSKSFNEVLEYSGLSPVDFAGLSGTPALAQRTPQLPQEPQQAGVPFELTPREAAMT